MKKAIYFLILMSAMTILTISCTKPADDELPFQVQYPDWKNLTWVSTDGSSLATTYPKLNISVDGNNVITVRQPYAAPNPQANEYVGTFAKMTIVGNTVSFTEVTNQALDVTGTFTKSGSQITLTTLGFTNTSRVYVLKIN